MGRRNGIRARRACAEPTSGGCRRQALRSRRRQQGRQDHPRGLAHLACARLRALSWRAAGRPGRAASGREPEAALERRVQANDDEGTPGEGHAEFRRQQNGHGKPRRPLRVFEGTLRRRHSARPSRRAEMRRSAQALVLAAAVLPLAWGAFAQPNAPVDDDRVLRVCEDPNNLPFSNRAGEGFENKLAELLARELGWTLEYTWFPQRMGFIRNTLRGREPNSGRFKCDLVLGVPVGFELAATTKPYYRSTYALAYAKGKG